MSKKFKFKIENMMYEWDRQFITGQEVRQLLGLEFLIVWLFYVKVPGKPGRLVSKDE